VPARRDQQMRAPVGVAVQHDDRGGR
jgi:hypothetical protein